MGQDPRPLARSLAGALGGQLSKGQLGEDIDREN